MILYLDTSALAKKYIEEACSTEVVALLGQADLIGASLLARVELPAAVAKAVRMHWLSAADGERALELVDQHPGIGAVLLDLRLPGRGGMEILREIQKRNPRTGVIMLSGLADREVARQAIKLGAFDYVTKPPDFPTLQSTLIACLSHSAYQSQAWWKKLMG